MTGYYVVEEEDSFHADDFGNDDARPAGRALLSELIDMDEDPDDFFADDFGNDDRPRPRAPTGLRAMVR